MQALNVKSFGMAPAILLIGAHCDDIEIGCSATLRRLAIQFPAARITWVNLSSDTIRAAETERAAAQVVPNPQRLDLRFKNFPASYFPQESRGIKDYFETLKQVEPDLVFTHFRGDLHQDHRVVNDLTWNTFRNHLVLEYEIPKFDGDLGVPNVFSALSQSEMEFKCQMLMDCFPSQHFRSWFSPETFRALARIRGIECNAPDGWAEAFFGRKICLDF